MMRFEDYRELSELIDLAIEELENKKDAIPTLRMALQKLERQQTRKPTRRET